MLRKITLAVALVAFLATPAFAAVQNVKVSGNINSSYVARMGFDFGANTSDELDQNVFITQSTLRVDADLSDNVQTVLQLINERAWTDVGSSSDDDLNINLAYVRMKELLYSPLTVEIGRMQLNYGNGFIIGNGTNNTTYASNPLTGVARDLANNTAFDTVRAILDYKPLTVDIFAAKIHANIVTGAEPIDDDVDLYGINANYQLGDDMNSVVEAYLFAQFDADNNHSGVGNKTDKLYVPGLRASTNPIGGLNLQGEVAWQKGTTNNVGAAAGDNDQRDALGFQSIVNYQVKQEDVEKYKPVLQGVYTFVSGDSNPLDRTATNQNSSNVLTGWNPMYEGQGGGKIYNALFNLSNAHIVEVSAAFNPIEDVTAKFSWTGLWNDKDLDRQAGLNPDGNSTISFTLPDGSSVTKSVTSNLELGNEFDAVFTYNYTEDVQFGLNMGWFVPGNAFSSENDETAKQAIANVSVNF